MKKAVWFLSFILIVTAGFFAVQNMQSDAKQVEFQIEATDETVEKGNDVTIKFSVTGDTVMKSVEAYIYYDETILEFQSADQDVFAGTSGMLKLSEEFEEGTNQVEYALTFTALEVGTTSFKVQEMYVEDVENEDVTTVDNSSAKVSVTKNNEESKDAFLESLEVFPETLTPVFSKNVYTYSMTVDQESSDIVISAIPSDSDSVVTVEGNENFQNGENEVTITVTSLSGVTKKYQIIVNKQ